MKICITDKDLSNKDVSQKRLIHPVKKIMLGVLLTPCLAYSATPIDGWYSHAFGGYAYIPGNISKTNNSLTYNHVVYESGFDAGGAIGFKSNPMRYEGEITYLKGNTEKFRIDNVQQTGVGGYNQAILGLMNVYYDFPGLLAPSLQPYIGAGLGYGWIQSILNATGPSLQTHFVAESSAFAYQGTAGISFNFAENYSLNVGYRYVGTNHLFAFGNNFQVQMATVGATYRFNENNYK